MRGSVPDGPRESPFLPHSTLQISGVTIYLYRDGAYVGEVCDNFVAEVFQPMKVPD
jgi:hypothetical protein